MFDTICTLPLPTDLFAQSLHPSSPIIAVGLASGHVQTHRLPPLNSAVSSTPKNGCGTIETLWRTKRHKGSCRALAFSTDGEHLFSAGTDGIVKAAATETGQVGAKIAVPLDDGDIDAPTLLHVPSPQTLLLATDSSALHLYDLRTPISISARPQQTHHPHEDYISSLTPLPPTEASTSGYSKQFVTTGGSTLAITDLRRGVLVKSEDQEEELLSSVFVGGLGGKNAEKVVVGCGNGVLTLWERGVWDDQGERVIVDAGRGGGESLDVLTNVPEGVGKAMGGKLVAVGLGDGRVRFVRLGGKGNAVVGDCRHDEVEGVLGLGFEVGGRMVSGGGSVVKVWQESVEDDEDKEVGVVGSKRKGSAVEEDSEHEEDVSSEEEVENKKQRKKKRKAAKAQANGGGKHVMAFKGMD